MTFLKRQKEAHRRLKRQEKQEAKRQRRLEKQQLKRDSLPSGGDAVQIQTKEQLKEQEQS
jgi:hypothetical protein